MFPLSISATSCIEYTKTLPWHSEVGGTELTDSNEMFLVISEIFQRWILVYPFYAYPTAFGLTALSMCLKRASPCLFTYALIPYC